MNNRHSAVPAVFALIIKDNKILIARRYNTGYQDGNYQVPTGHVEKNELPKEAMIREAGEEIGIVPTSYELVHVQYCSGHYSGGDRIDFFYRVTEWKGEISNAEPKKCDDLRFVDLDKLPDNMTPHVRNGIDCMLSGIHFSELDIKFVESNPLYSVN